jgi:DNA polymerase-3 subunit beta
MVATDGHRLSLIRNKALSPGEEAKVIIPRKGIVELKRMLAEEGDIFFSIEDNNIAFSRDNIIIVIRLLEGDFPDYEKVIPKSFSKKMIASNVDFKDRLRRVDVLANERSRAIKLTIKPDEMIFFSADPETGQASDTMPVEYNGEEITIGFNCHYILDILENLESKKVAIELNDHLSPCMVKGVDEPDYLSILMPMRV